MGYGCKVLAQKEVLESDMPAGQEISYMTCLQPAQSSKQLALAVQI